MYLDIFFDTVCPWCLIGKKRLENALESRPHVSLKIRWKPFLLNPTMGPNGIDRQVYLSHKFGGEQRAQRIYDVIAETGKKAGIDFKFGNIKVTPNSVNSHRLIAYARKFDAENQMVDRLFHAYFMEGQDIGNIDVLCQQAQKIGLNEQDCQIFLNTELEKEEVLASDKAARELGVHGVPAFLARDRFVISGAQEEKILGKFIDTAWNG